MFDDLYFVDLMVINLVFVSSHVYVSFVFFLPACMLIFLVLGKRLSGKSVPEMTIYA